MVGLFNETSKSLMGRAKFPLHANFKPSEFDVLCGRGKSCYHWCGNQRFRTSIEQTLDSYQKSDTKLRKSVIVMEIVDLVRLNSPDGGGFVREIKGQWYEIGDEAAREKVGQTIRDALIQLDPEKRARKRMKRAVRKAKRVSRTQTLTMFDISKLLDLEPAPLIEEGGARAQLNVPSTLPQTPIITEEDEMLASMPPVLAFGTSRDWSVCLLQGSDSDSFSASSEDFSDAEDFCNVPAVAA
jgi:hypothetical protein